MLVSVIVPIYNAEKYLDNCIRSIIMQTYKEWELLLINDGSTDDSERICLTYAGGDTRIHYYFKENGGVSSARNYGMDFACGEFITFVDADDFLDVEYLNIMVSLLSDPSIRMAVSGLKYYRNDSLTEAISYRLLPGKYDANMLNKVIVDDGTLSGFTFHSSCAILFDLKLIRNHRIRFNEQLAFNEDGLFVAEYCLKNDSISINVDFSIAAYNYRVNTDSASKNIDIDRYINDMKMIEKVLNNYNIPEISDQLLLRRVTSAVDLLGFYRKTGQLSFEIVNNSLNKKRVNDGIRLLSVKKQNPAKKVLVYMLKKHWHYYVYVLFQLYGLIKHDQGKKHD